MTKSFSFPFIWISEQQAKDAGCTHESVLFGVPGYSHVSPDDPNDFFFVPKFYPANIYLWCANAAYALFAANMPEDNEIATPFREVRVL